MAARPIGPAVRHNAGARLGAELLRLLDVTVAIVLFAWLEHEASDVHLTAWSAGVPFPHAFGYAGVLVLWPVVLGSVGLYRPLHGPPGEAMVRVLVACTAGTLLAWGLACIGGGSPPLAAILFFWAAASSSALAFRSVPRAYAAVPSHRPARRVVIVGSGPRAARLLGQLESDSYSTYDLLGFVDTRDCGALNGIVPHLGTLDDLEPFLMRCVVDEVLVALPIKSCYSEIQQVIGACERMGTESRYLADVFQCTLARPRFEPLGPESVVAMKVFCDDSRLLVKRLIDIAGALTGLVLLSPVLLAVALAVRLTSPGPVIFTQERYGLNKRRFRMYKFRTMVASAEEMQETLEALNEASGAVFKIRDDPRITPVGHLLRRTSLDELPQLVNVLLGHMSLVGPRPLPMRDVARFDEPWFMRRFSVRPGLTCLWQISGRSTVGFDDWMALDLEYIDRWSLGLDLRILARTLPAVLAGTGAA